MKCRHCGRKIKPYAAAAAIWTVGGGWGSACAARKRGAGYDRHEPDFSDRDALEAWLAG